MPAATRIGFKAIVRWHVAGVFAESGAAGSIHGRTGGEAANLLESWCAASHTGPVRYAACCLVRQRSRPSLSAKQHGADRRIRTGGGRPAADNRIVTTASRNVVRYSHRPGCGSPENGHGLPHQSNRRTATGQPHIHAPMTACRKNIDATPPQFATVAPILHGSMTVTANCRNPNLNNGAADADGR